MAADVLIQPTAPGDVEILIANLRESDRLECEAYGDEEGIAPGIRRSVERSTHCWTVWINGELAAILGVAPLNLLTGLGSPWMLGTPVLDRHARVLVQQTPRYIETMREAFPHLVNFVHAKNTTSVRWLRRLGFTLYPPQPYGRLGEPFHPFEMRA